MNFTTTIILCLSLCWAASAGAQDCQALSPGQSGSTLLSDLLGEDAQGITGACQVAAGDDYYSARVEFRGFADQEYQLTGQLLDADRRSIPGSEPVRIPLESGATAVDLTFRFTPAQAGYTEPYVAVRYLKVSIAEAGDPLSELDLGGFNLLGTTAEYRLDHQFRVGASGNGTSNVTVAVAFTPVMRAATIKQ